MTPSGVVGTALCLLLAGGPAWSASSCGGNDGVLKQQFIAGTNIDANQDSGCSAVLEIQAGRPAGDTDAAFEKRWRQASSSLGLTSDESAQAKLQYESRWERGAAPGHRSTGRQADSGINGKRINQSAAGIATALGTTHEDAGALAAIGALPSGPSPVSAGEIARRLNSQLLSGRGLEIHKVPNIDVLHAMGSLEVAPAPTIAMRLTSLWDRGAPSTVAEDVSNVRRLASALQMTPEQAVGLASSQAQLNDFVSWVKNSKDSDLPKIEYGILNEGEIGRYVRHVFSQSQITLNIWIKDAEPEARAAVLFHELYHYWDNEVAKLDYQNVAYGYIDRGHLPEHEYDAYYMTATLWQQARPRAASSALAGFLDTLPVDRDRVAPFVEGNLKEIKDK